MGLKLGEGNQPQGELQAGRGVGCKAGSELAVCPAGRFVGPPTTWPPKCCCGRATARSQTCGHWAVSCKCTGWGGGCGEPRGEVPLQFVSLVC